MNSILVIDDNSTCRDSMTKILEREGYSVQGVKDVPSALEALNVQPYDMLVCDYRMPGRTGLELLSELRQARRAMPVVMVSAFADDDTEAAAKRLGAGVLLRKPFRRQQLVDEARRCLRPGS